ncbi:hypothetical protein GH714_030855 [Hevea brasiliensis]|uniref:Serine-threonine/tyrosine-protein kinase catalytic domain-containing protein n=1 Tax=Hevea brasiliensis TaxID=3981 RepID=A0A6A6NK22_HEVBR|nr:hypothetical protein GH714_030855 [Hevea brasiliensis]
MKLGINKKTGKTWKLTSWFGEDIPRPAAFTMEWDPSERQVIVKRRGIKFWTSGMLTHDNKLENFRQDESNSTITSPGFQPKKGLPYVQFSLTSTSTGEIKKGIMFPGGSRLSGECTEGFDTGRDCSGYCSTHCISKHIAVLDMKKIDQEEKFLRELLMPDRPNDEDELKNSRDNLQMYSGYMSPEYAMEGIFSVKSDVYSFGVLMLEIISSKRNHSTYHYDRPLNLLGYAWELWKEDAFEMLDPTMRDSAPREQVLRCINVALLCVEHSEMH